MLTRREFLATSAAVGAAACLQGQARAQEGKPVRTYHLSVSIDALEADPDLPATIAKAGVTDVWVAAWFQGVWYKTPEDIRIWKERLAAHGLDTHVITIPLGHPTFSEELPDYMPPMAAVDWKRGVRPDGKTHGGVALHPPITEANVEALEKTKEAQVRHVFLDDDFRLAPSPDDIGGCFCDEHRAAFLERHGHSEGRWAELLDDVQNRRYSPLVRQWVEGVCDELTASFKAQQKAAAPEMDLGIMVMFMGSEKAGIRLDDYRDVPFRVGELMFSDESFAPVKGKTGELFSALFHRRFAGADLAYSETTAWPWDKLSAANMAAKLAVSTLSDCRRTMFMSGNTPFPKTHWTKLGPAMRKQADLHARVAGHTPRGPFKHFWGERSRVVGDSNAFSLFLAAGVPFEVTGDLAADGYTFLSHWDAEAAAAGELRSPGTTLVHRPAAGLRVEGAREVAETLPDLFALKHEIAPTLGDVPYVQEDVPVVCAWYPDRGAMLLWNLTEEPQTLTVRLGEKQRSVVMESLGTELVEGLGA